MASLKEIRRRIMAVRGTQKVTRAMKLVAAAKLKRAQTTAINARDYSLGLFDTAMSISRHLGPTAPALWRRPEKIECLDLLVISSDRGLCGGFNENLFKALSARLSELKKHNISYKLYILGRKIAGFCKLKKYEAVSAPIDLTTEAKLEWLMDALKERFLKGESSGCDVLFSRFASAARQTPTFWNLLPLHCRGNENERHLGYINEPSKDAALNDLARLTLVATLRQATLESGAAELAARMTAMDNATRNADEMIGHLTFLYNRARQESITKELLDILGGAEALK